MIANIQIRHNQFSAFQIALILIALGLCAYFNAIFHPFVHDDVVFIQNNPRIADLNLESIFSPPAVAGVGQMPSGDQNAPLINTYYRPLLELFYRVQFKFFHLNPHGYHLFNILLHIFNSFIVYSLFNILIKNNRGISLGAAVLFLLHPVQTEAVACISGISNLLFASLCLISLIFYIISAEGDRKIRNLFLYMSSLAIFFVSFLAKEQAVILPLLIVLYEICFPPNLRKDLKKRFFRVTGYFLMLGGYFLIRKVLLGVALSSILDFKGELGLRVLSIPRTLLAYFGIIFFPHDLHYYRSVDILQPFVIPSLLLLAVLGALFVIIRLTSKSYRGLCIFGLGWFFISLLPVLNIIPLINEYSLILTAEHFLYMPLIGMLLFVLGVIYSLLIKIDKKTEKPWGIFILGIVSFLFLGLTLKQNTYWAGEIPLFQRTLRYEQRLGRVHILLAKAYYFNGQFKEAIEEDRKALTIMQGYAEKVENEDVKGFYLGFIKGIHFDLAHYFEALGDHQSSLEQYKKALDIDPYDGVLHNNLGVNYLNLSNVEQAIKHFERAVALNANDLMAMNNLALCYIDKGESEKAEALLRHILSKDSQFVTARKNLEKLLSSKE